MPGVAAAELHTPLKRRSAHTGRLFPFFPFPLFFFFGYTDTHVHIYPVTVHVCMCVCKYTKISVYAYYSVPMVVHSMLKKTHKVLGKGKVKFGVG